MTVLYTMRIAFCTLLVYFLHHHTPHFLHCWSFYL